VLIKPRSLELIVFFKFVRFKSDNHSYNWGY
jgi:hypothetical protein